MAKQFNFASDTVEIDEDELKAKDELKEQTDKSNEEVMTPNETDMICNALVKECNFLRGMNKCNFNISLVKDMLKDAHTLQKRIKSKKGCAEDVIPTDVAKLINSIKAFLSSYIIYRYVVKHNLEDEILDMLSSTNLSNNNKDYILGYLTDCYVLPHFTDIAYLDRQGMIDKTDLTTFKNTVEMTHRYIGFAVAREKNPYKHNYYKTGNHQYLYAREHSKAVIDDLTVILNNDDFSYEDLSEFTQKEINVVKALLYDTKNGTQTTQYLKREQSMDLDFLSAKDIMRGEKDVDTGYYTKKYVYGYYKKYHLIDDTV